MELHLWFVLSLGPNSVKAVFYGTYKLAYYCAWKQGRILAIDNVAIDNECFRSIVPLSVRMTEVIMDFG
jgi:hypothetical protein